MGLHRGGGPERRVRLPVPEPVEHAGLEDVPESAAGSQGRQQARGRRGRRGRIALDHHAVLAQPEVRLDGQIQIVAGQLELVVVVVQVVADEEADQHQVRLEAVPLVVQVQPLDAGAPAGHAGVDHLDVQVGPERAQSGLQHGGGRLLLLHLDAPP